MCQPSLLTILFVFVTGHLSFSTTARGEEHWLGFRGRGDGHSHVGNLPFASGGEAAPAERWRLPLPGYGQSSPVVWQDYVFVTVVSGPEKEHLHVLGIDLHDGRLLWQRDFLGTQRVPNRDSVSRAAPTPTVDSARLYCVFESGDVMALTHDGEVLWQRSFVGEFGDIQGAHGYASSPLLVDGHLIVQVVHSGPSYVLALNSATGATAWKVDHPSQTGWSSPVAFSHGSQRGIIVSTAGSVRALGIDDGSELWRVVGVQGNSTASPTVVDDLVLIGVGEVRSGGGGRPGAASAEASSTIQPVAPQQALADPITIQPVEDAGSFAVRLGGRGDVTQTHIAWKAPRVTCGYASPVALDGAAYFVKKSGVVQCVDLTDGQLRWQRRLPGETWASPIAHNGHVIFFTKNGSVATLNPQDGHGAMTENSISAAGVVYGVAAAKDSWVVRTGNALTRIGHSEGE